MRLRSRKTAGLRKVGRDRDPPDHKPPTKPPSKPDPALECCKAVNRKVDALIVQTEELTSRISKLEARLAKIDKKIDGLDEDIEKLDAKLDLIISMLQEHPTPEPAARMEIHLGDPAQKPEGGS